MASDIKLIGESVELQGNVHVSGETQMGGKVTMTALRADDVHIGTCNVGTGLSGSFLGRSELFIRSRAVRMSDPSSNQHGVALAVSGQDELILNDAKGFQGGVKIEGNTVIGGNLQVMGAIGQSSSRELKEDIGPLSGTEAAAILDRLNPVKFFYKEGACPGAREQRVGFIAEETPGLLTTQAGTAVSAMDVVAVLTRTVQAQQETLARLIGELDVLKRALGALGTGS